MQHPDQELHNQLTQVFNGFFARERLDNLFANVGSENNAWLQEQVAQATNQIITTPVVVGGYQIEQPWVRTAVVSVMNESGKLMMVQSMPGDYSRYQNTDEVDDLHYYKRPAIAKAVARRLLDISGLGGGIEQHWEWLKNDCGYAWHTGDAMTALPDGRKLWIGVTATEPNIAYRLALLGYPNAPHAVIRALANDPNSIWMQAGRFDTIMAEGIGDVLSRGTMIGVPKSILAEANN